jgi:ABC-type uncharacterized transport system permease subunit
VDQVLTAMISTTLAVGALIVIAGIGELLAELTGVINLGIEGIIAVGAVAALLVVIKWVPNVWIGLLGGAIVGLLCGLLFALASVTLKANQFISGLGMGLLGLGLANHAGRSIAGQLAPVRFSPIQIPVLAGIPVLGEAVFDQNILAYFSYFILPALAWYLLFRTRHGLSMRAAGQDPATAEACGVRVDRYRFFYASLAGLMFGIGGAYLGLGLNGSWGEGLVAGRGWIALTLVFFSGWNPLVLILGAILFGATTSLGFSLQLQGVDVSPYLIGMLPYLATLLLFVLAHLVRKRKQPGHLGIGPTALGVPYYRE